MNIETNNTLLWATDVHLDHVGHPRAARAFGESLSRKFPDSHGLLLTGDIAEGPSVRGILRDLEQGLQKPVYFVLGNHDYYRSSFVHLDCELKQAFAPGHDKSSWLRLAPLWFSRRNGQEGGVALVGNGGFYDARYGDENSQLAISDFVRIKELFEAQDAGRQELLLTIRQRADLLASELKAQLEEVATHSPQRVIVATHIPPFREAAFYQGQTSNDEWAPFFSSRVMGEVILAQAAQHPQTEFIVLCGHTHGSGTYLPRKNLKVHTGAARYGAPQLAGQLDWKSGELTGKVEG